MNTKLQSEVVAVVELARPEEKLATLMDPECDHCVSGNGKFTRGRQESTSYCINTAPVSPEWQYPEGHSTRKELFDNTP